MSKKSYIWTCWAGLYDTWAPSLKQVQGLGEALGGALVSLSCV